MQWGLPLLSVLPSWFEPAVINGPAKRLLTQIGAKKKEKQARKHARVLSCLIYFFGPFSIYYILHDYVIPQAMPHAIPQTHSSFYLHRLKYTDSSWRFLHIFHTMGEIKTGNPRFPAPIQFDLHSFDQTFSVFREYFFLNHRKRFHQKLEFSAISLSLFTCSLLAGK